MQAVSVGYWRGEPKRWNNTFHYTTSAQTPNYTACLAAAHTILQALGTPYVPGGNSSIALYPVDGGVPLAETTFFNWEAPGSWVQWNGTIWGTSTTPTPTSGEAAVVFKVAAGVSSSGKPVSLRSYWHAFLAQPDTASTPQLSSAIITAAVTQYNKLQVLNDGAGGALVLSKPDGTAVANTATLGGYVETHQRVRGRRRKSVTIDGKRYYPATSSAHIVPVEAD
uniref:Uncharacterized protein n=1 Tax=uncultured prokaryote TaxID=198431 RepID=A0A0H5Q3V7_9ZZZZ|nr:hypothetical protein [uncultured prokaryote]